MFGGAARVVLHVVLPAGARQACPLALGLGLGVAGPLLGTAALMAPRRRRPPTTGRRSRRRTCRLARRPDRPTDTGLADHHRAAGPHTRLASRDRIGGHRIVVRGDCL